LTVRTAGGVGLRTERGPVLGALMLATALVAIDSTIIATAVPSIVHSLGGFSSFPWLFSIYLLAQAVTVPVHGKLADVFGRKPLILFGISVFCAGSVLCGIAWSMPSLIAFRLVQGIGAGAVQPMSITIVGDLFSLAERPKVQGYLASVWGICSVIGPALGGLLSQYASWRWIFFVNVPLCAVAVTMLWRVFDERTEPRRTSIDVPGAVLLTSGSTLVILGLLEGGQSWAWTSPAGMAVPIGGAVLLGAFVAFERRVREPILPLWVFRRRLLLTSSLISAAVGALVLGLTSYVPTYAQDVLGAGPLVAGFALATLTLGWPLAASQSGRLYLRAGFRACALTGSVLILATSAFLLALDAASSIMQVAITCFGIGIGLGFVAGPTIIAAQSSVGWADRGVVTASNMFSRSLGSAVGIAVFGAVANATFGAGEPAGSRHPSDRAAGDLVVATHHVFECVIVVALLLLLAVVAMPTGQTAPAADLVAPPLLD
jgi:EmrB/QacA subfamily drug resistance transporter